MTLSSPPWSFAAAISARVAALRSSRLPQHELGDAVARRPSSSGRPSRAGRRRRRAPATVNASTSTSGSVPSARVITERCGCTSASAGDSSPRRTSSATSEWSSVSCSSSPVAEQVGARVADVADRDRAVRSSKSATVIVVPIPEAAASSSARWWTRRFASWISSATCVLAAAARARARSRERGGRERRGDLARLGAAHAVGDREQRRVADEGVLVAAPLAAGVGLAVALRRSRLRASSVTARTAGQSRRSARRRRGPTAARAVRRMPLTNVPFVEPASST